MLSGLAPARRRLVIAVGVLVVVAVIAVAAVLVADRGGRSATAPVAQAVPGPVLLIPGYGGSTTSLQTLAVRLRQAGRTAEVLSLPDGGVGDLGAQAATLDAAARALVKRTGSATLDLVGYSAGGVVARIWLRDDGGARLTRRLVTLGSPQHGTEIAGLAAGFAPSQCPTACRQLTQTSSLLAQLNSGNPGGSEVAAGPTYVSLWTSSDTVVVPPESAVLQGALNIRIQTVCPSSTVSHTNLPRDPQVQAMVLDELRAGPPRPLTGADCVPAGA